MTGIIEQMPEALAELGDVMITTDGPRLCVGRDLYERECKDGEIITGWLYHGTAWNWDKEKKKIVRTGNWNKYTKNLIREVKQLTPHPKTGEPCY